MIARLLLGVWIGTMIGAVLGLFGCPNWLTAVIAVVYGCSALLVIKGLDTAT